MLRFSCSSTIFCLFFLEFLPPELGPNQHVIEGTGPISLTCNNPNSPEVSLGVQWFRDGLLQTESQSLLFFPPIQRERAGSYECRLTSLIDASILSGMTELIVQCKLHHVAVLPLWLASSTCRYVAILEAYSTSCIAESLGYSLPIDRVYKYTNYTIFERGLTCVHIS